MLGQWSKIERHLSYSSEVHREVENQRVPQFWQQDSEYQLFYQQILFVTYCEILLTPKHSQLYFYQHMSARKLLHNSDKMDHSLTKRRDLSRAIKDNANMFRITS